MRNNFWVQIDKLKVCYTATNEVISQLKDIDKYIGEGYKLYSIPTEIEGITTLAIDILWDGKENEGLRYWRFGYLTIGDTFKDANSNYIWMTIENRMLYEMFYKSNILGNNSLQMFSVFIADDLNLQFNNFTSLHIAVDTDVKDFIKRIRKHIKKFVPIVANKAYENKEEVIHNLKYISVGNRLKITNTSVYVDIENAELCCYNKTEELKESSKNYINFDTEKEVTRLEIRLNNKAIKEYISQRNISLEDLYYLICQFEDKKTLIDIFQYYSNRLIRFRDDNKNIYSLLELPR